MTTQTLTLNRQLTSIPKRAELSQDTLLAETFANSGVVAELETVDHQVLYGRRGTGKTHALKYYAAQRRAEGDVALFVDLRTMSSPITVTAQDRRPPIEQALFIYCDLLAEFRDQLYELVTTREDLFENQKLADSIDQLAESISKVRIMGTVEKTRELESENASTGTKSGSANISLRNPAINFGRDKKSETTSSEVWREVETGTELPSIDHRGVNRSIREIVQALDGIHIWLLLDEWSAVALEAQPYLAEFASRSLFANAGLTVKIAAIRQDVRFSTKVDGRVIGFETGADTSGSISLDDFMVFEGNEEFSRSFFKELFFKHLSVRQSASGSAPLLTVPDDVVRFGFADRRAFDELVRASEGVPRDALNIAAKAAIRSRNLRITVPDIRFGARSWYQEDKMQNLSSNAECGYLLTWIHDEVIKERKARAFLVSEEQASDPLLSELFNQRVLHVVRRGYSAQDEPGVRYQVWVVDYGAYVDLLHTKFRRLSEEALISMLELSRARESRNDVRDEFEELEVPEQDLRAIRRSILDIDKFYEESRQA